MEIILIKNNKHNNYTRGIEIFDKSGILQAIVFKIKGITKRKRHQGENFWDIFFICSKKELLIEKIIENKINQPFILGKRDGLEIGFNLREKIDGILGTEYIVKKELDFDLVEAKTLVEDVENCGILIENVFEIKQEYENLIISFKKSGGYIDTNLQLFLEKIYEMESKLKK